MNAHNIYFPAPEAWIRISWIDMIAFEIFEYVGHTKGKFQAGIILKTKETMGLWVHKGLCNTI